MNFSNPLTWFFLPCLFAFGSYIMDFAPYLFAAIAVICVVTVAARNLSTEDTRPNV